MIFTGDLNARTGNHLDFISGDSVSHIPIDHLTYDIDVAVGERYNNDKIVDSSLR